MVCCYSVAEKWIFTFMLPTFNTQKEWHYFQYSIIFLFSITFGCFVFIPLKCNSSVSLLILTAVSLLKLSAFYPLTFWKYIIGLFQTQDIQSRTGNSTKFWKIVHIKQVSKAGPLKLWDSPVKQPICFSYKMFYICIELAYIQYNSLFTTETKWKLRRPFNPEYTQPFPLSLHCTKRLHQTRRGISAKNSLHTYSHLPAPLLLGPCTPDRLQTIQNRGGGVE